jgi:hypothetical protein
MSKVQCNLCGKSNDSRSMQVCNCCRSYVCDYCYADHRLDCADDPML